MNQISKKNKLQYGKLVRKIIRQAKTAVLSTLLKEGDWPYGSLVLSCCEHDGSPFIFVSDLAEHTKAIKNNSKVSIFYENYNFLDDPLKGTRVSIICSARVVKNINQKNILLNRFLYHHPEAKIYSHFDDFNIFRLYIIKAHLIEGFGKIFWLNRTDIIGNKFNVLIEKEKQIIDYINLKKLFDFNIVGIDPEGYDFLVGKKYFREEFKIEIKNFKNPVQEVIKSIKKLIK